MFVLTKPLLVNNAGKPINFLRRHFCASKSKPAAAAESPSLKKTYGQPTHETHPTLLAKNDITPLIKASEYRTRRQKLLAAIASDMKQRYPEVKKHLIVIPSAGKQYMSDKIPYVFRQNTEFLYLTGCQEPDSCAVLELDDRGGVVTLFMREKDSNSELWDGPRTGPGDAPLVFGVDQALPVTEFEQYLNTYIKSRERFSLWYDYTNPVQISYHNLMCDYLNRMTQKIWESPKTFIHEQRLIKSDAEAELMQQSCDVASEAIVKTIQFSRPGINEHKLFAKVDYECRMLGAEFLAYPPVIAGGNRATTIHYINNNQHVQNGDMILMDAGCEYHGYASDITRTWPVNGKFTVNQRTLYEIVLDVQQELIALCCTFPTLDSLFESMCLLLGKRLQEIGLISRQLNNNGVMKSAYQFCPHHVSHYLGMDVHDTPLITRNIKIRPGMVVTVEPGIYISMDNTTVPKEFRGLGIRIEDDVLITDDGPIVLSRNCPKSVDEIERIASQIKD